MTPENTEIPTIRPNNQFNGFNGPKWTQLNIQLTKLLELLTIHAYKM